MSSPIHGSRRSVTLDPIIESMSLYDFHSSQTQDVNVLTATGTAARPRAATVVKSLAGTLRLELTPTQVTEVAQARPGWRYFVERKTIRVAECKPLECSKASGARVEVSVGVVRPVSPPMQLGVC